MASGALPFSPAAWAFLFGILQFPVAVVAPDLERLAGVSAGGALASLLYASAAVVASVRVLLATKGNGGVGGAEVATERGRSAASSSSSSAWQVLDACSTILFAFGGHFVSCFVSFSFLWAREARGRRRRQKEKETKKLTLFFLSLSSKSVKKKKNHFKVLPEIAASLSSSSSSLSSSPHSAPPSSSPMFPAVRASYLAVALSYFSVAAAGAAAFGARVADDVLLSDGAGPSALIAAANAAVCFHVAAGFHVFSQPCYSRFEGWFEGRGWFGGGGGGDQRAAAASLPTTAAEAPPPAPPAPAAGAAGAVSVSPASAPAPMTRASLAARLCYVFLVAASAAALPFFSVCMSLVGALAFAPATFVLPPAFAFFSRAPSMRRNKRRRAVHGAMTLAFGILSVACLVSAARGLVVALDRRLRGV